MSNPRWVTAHGKRILVEDLDTGIKPKTIKRKKFAVVSLVDDWGYRVMTVAGHGAAVVVHALYVQKSTGRGDVPITLAVLQRCGITRKQRWLTINRLVKAGLATVHYRGSKFRGSPLLTMLTPGGCERSQKER
jgi:hypothetical protein